MIEVATRPAGGAIQLLQLTDPHLFGSTRGMLAGVSTLSTWRSVLAEAWRSGPRPDLLLVTGDLIHDHRPETYQILIEDLAALDVPTLVLPGNHDDGDLMREAFATHPSVRWEGHALAGSWLVVMLDSTVPGSPGGHLARSELDRLSELLRAYPEHPTLIALHHQPVAVGSRWLDCIGVDNGEELLALSQSRPQVRIVLWGHVHQEVDRVAGGLRLLATPSTCIQFRPGEQDFALDDEAPGWRRLSLYPDGRFATQVGRLERLPPGLNLSLRGY